MCDVWTSFLIELVNSIRWYLTSDTFPQLFDPRKAELINRLNKLQKVVEIGFLFENNFLFSMLRKCINRGSFLNFIWLSNLSFILSQSGDTEAWLRSSHVMWLRWLRCLCFETTKIRLISNSSRYIMNRSS